jgi:hypothetical protein
MVCNVKVMGYYIYKVSLWVVAVGKWKVKNDMLSLAHPGDQHRYPGKKILARGLALKEVIKLELQPNGMDGEDDFFRSRS